MKEKSRYDTSNMIDAQIEPGFGGRGGTLGTLRRE
jgi:hypothetical protein